MATAKPTEKEAACVVALKKKFPASAADPADAGFLSDTTYLRFARARDGNVEKATEMLGAALEWRKQAKPYAITSAEVEKAMTQMTMTCGGKCKIGCPVIVMQLGAQNDCEVEERTKQLIYIMEETQRRGYDRITWLVDFSMMGQHRDDRSKAARKETMKIMQDYYPERMARILLYRPPWYVRMLLGLAKAFMDARTAAKIFKAGSTIEELEQYIKRDQVPKQCGGTMEGTSLSHLQELPSLNHEEAKVLGDAQHAADAEAVNDANRISDRDSTEGAAPQPERAPAVAAA